jgi:23S rRNA (pseudouridine1915-N3)-methyltransferase
MIHIFHISDGHKHFSIPIEEYINRLGKKVEIHTIKHVKHTEKNYIKREETLKLKEKLMKFRWTLFLCDERGKDISTTQLERMIQDQENNGENMLFIIWGSYGVDIELLRDSFARIELIRLSHFVLPHGLAFLVLIEQIYRSYEIRRGSGYHHE